MINAIFKPLDTEVYTNPAKQWDYGQILRIQGVTLPKAVEVHFGISGEENTVPSVGVTDGDHTDVEIPDGLLRQPNDLVAYVYIADVEKGNTVKTINIPVIARAKPAIPHTPEDEAVFREAIEAVNTAADRAEKAGQTATEAAGQAAEDAQQTAEDRKEVEKMVETVSDISEQVKKVEQLSQQAQEAATKTEADAQQTAEDRVEVGKMLETVKDVSEQVKSVEESVRKAKESEQAAARHRTAVEEMKNSVEQTASTFPQTVQSGIQAVENAGASEVQEITQAGTAQKTAVEAAGTQAVESVENVQQVATEAVETAKTEAVQSVQTEGNTQTGNVTTEGTKQVKAVQDKGNEVLQSIPEDFQMQMESKLDKQQGIENKGKVLVIGEDGNVVPEEVASGGGDGIAIINTMSGESPLVIPDSAERVNKRLELGGKTEQVTTTGAQLFDISKCPLEHDDVHFKIPKSSGNVILMGDFEENTQYTLSAQKINSENANSAVFKFDYTDGTRNEIRIKDLTKKSLTSDSAKNVKQFVLINPFGGVHEVSGLQIEKGTTATPYEPYTGGKPAPSPEYPQEIKNSGKWNDEKQKYEIVMQVKGADTELQSLTLTSDRPITKWEKLVEQGGQIGWLYGTEKYVVTGQEEFITNKSYALEESVDFSFINSNQAGIRNATDNFCNKLTFVDAVWSKNDIGFGISGSEVHIRLSLDTIGATKTDESEIIKNKFTEYLSKKYSDGEPFEFWHKSKTQEFVPLPQSEQNAIRALKTYYPTTVITADGGELDPDIKVTYTADTKNYIDNKVSAKVASIIRQYRLNTANLLSLMPMETQATMIENDTNNILNNLGSEETHE